MIGGPARMRVARLWRFRHTHHLDGAAVPWCNPHAHDYTVEVVVGGTPDENGMIVDTDELDGLWARERARLEAYDDLNAGTDTSTSVEALAGYWFKMFADRFAGVHSVTVWEDDDRWGRCSYS